MLVAALRLSWPLKQLTSQQSLLLEAVLSCPLPASAFPAMPAAAACAASAAVSGWAASATATAHEHRNADVDVDVPQPVTSGSHAACSASGSGAAPPACICTGTAAATGMGAGKTGAPKPRAPAPCITHTNLLNIRWCRNSGLNICPYSSVTKRTRLRRQRCLPRAAEGWAHI